MDLSRLHVTTPSPTGLDCSRSSCWASPHTDAHSTGKGNRDSTWGCGLVYPNRAAVWHVNSQEKVVVGDLGSPVPTAARMEHPKDMPCAMG